MELFFSFVDSMETRGMEEPGAVFLRFDVNRSFADLQTSRLEGDGGAGVKDLKEIEEMEVFEDLKPRAN